MKQIIPILSLFILTACSSQTCNQNQVLDETYVHRYGVAVPPTFWNSSGADGAVVSTMSDGVVITRNYEQGRLQGDTTYTFPHSSQIQRKEVYEQETVVKEVSYFYDGTPQSEIVFNTPEGMKEVSTWYLSGTPKSIEYYNNGKLISGQYFTKANLCDSIIENGEGTRLVRDDYGQLLSTDIFQDGLPSSSISYHANGNPKEQITYSNGVIDGTKRTFYQDGEPNTIEGWKNGRQEGMMVTYQHGEKLTETPYANGYKHGVERRYRDGTTVVQETTWNRGQLHGPCTTYAGETTKTDWYYQGCPTTEADYQFMMNRPVMR